MSITNYEFHQTFKDENLCVPQTAESKLGRFKKKATAWAWRIGLATTLSIGGYFANTKLSRADGEKLFGPPPIAWAHSPSDEELKFVVSGTESKQNKEEAVPQRILALGTEVTQDDLRDQGCRPVHTFPEAGIIAECSDGVPNLSNASVYVGTVTGEDPSWNIQQQFVVGAWNELLNPVDKRVLSENPAFNSEEFIRKWGHPGEQAFVAPTIAGRTTETEDNDLGPNSQHTSDIIAGSTAVRIFFPESDGTVDPSTENWPLEEKKTAFNGIIRGLDWWADHAPPEANVSFVYSPRFVDSVETSVEPISRPSSDQVIWVREIMTKVGFGGGVNMHEEVRAYDNFLRDTYNTNWGVSIFIPNSINDPDRLFADGYFGWAYLGGPHSVIPFDNKSGLFYVKVIAHEFGHTGGWALDTYFLDRAPCTERAGYLWVENQNSRYNPLGGSCATDENDVMRGGVGDFFNRPDVNIYTRGQVGWWDLDGDGIIDPLNNDFHITFGITNTTGIGSVEIVPNIPPNPDIAPFTINNITDVELSINGEPVQGAIPTDGKFDSPREGFQFPIPQVFVDANIEPPISLTVLDSAGNTQTETYNNRVKTTINGIPDIVYQGDQFTITGTITPILSTDEVGGAECRIGNEDWQPAVPVGSGGSGSFQGPISRVTCSLDTNDLPLGSIQVELRGYVIDGGLLLYDNAPDLVDTRITFVPNAEIYLPLISK